MYTGIQMTNSVYRDSNVYQLENKHDLFLHIETIKSLKRKKKKRTNKQKTAVLMLIT